MNVATVGQGTDVAGTTTAARPGRSFQAVLADAIDAADAALGIADGKAAAVAAGQGTVMDASLARAKADVLLDVVSVTAARVSAAINALLQTQV